MSGLRAISPVDDSTESHYVKSIRSVCSMHAIPVGSPQNLAAFLKGLDADKLLAMEFWAMVARLSDESSGLSISAMNGVVIEVVMQAVTGRGVAEMVAAGREPRRLVGELGCLLAGEDLNSPIEISPSEAAPALVEALDAKAAASDPQASDVDKLRADVALLKAAFEAQFGMEAGHPSAPFPIAREEQEEPASPGPPQALKDTASAIQPPEPREPALPAPRAPASVTHHSVYAEAQALSSSQRESWSYQAIEPATPVPAVIIAEAPPIPAASESESEPRIAATLETPIPAAKELSVPAPEQPSISTPSSTAPSATKVTPIPRPRLEVKPAQSASIHAVPVAETGLAGPEDSGKRILMGGTLLLLVGVGLSAPWWFTPKAMNPTHVTTGSSTGAASDSTPTPARTVSVPAPSHPKPAAAAQNPASANRPPEKTPNKITAETLPDNLESASKSEPAKSAESAKNGRPQLSAPTPPAANAGPTLSVAPANTAATTATPSPAPHLTAAAILPPAAATADRTAPAPVVRVPPTPENQSTPHAVSGGVMEGAKISGQNPIYPAFAKTAHISGSIVLHATISKAGTVENLKVVSGPLTLQQSAIAAVKTWKYKPYLLNGDPTEVDTSIVVNFRLVD